MTELYCTVRNLFSGPRDRAFCDLLFAPARRSHTQLYTQLNVCLVLVCIRGGTPGDFRVITSGTSRFVSFSFLWGGCLVGSKCVWFCFTVFSGLTACFPALFSSFQHIYGKWVPGVCFTDSFLALFSLALRLVFRFWFRGSA